MPRPYDEQEYMNARNAIVQGINTIMDFEGSSMDAKENDIMELVDNTIEEAKKSDGTLPQEGV